MPGLARFGVSLEDGLLRKSDILLKEKGYSNRSEFIRDLIRNELVKKEWLDKTEVVGAITLVYDHHKRELINSLTDIQHDFHELIVSGQHIHLDSHNCLEIIAVKGSPKRIDELANKLRSAKGVKHGGLSMTTTGKNLV